ncbi:MAG: TerC family protein [Terriglobia bacterium]|jgi:tellurite resistance protein TerC
MMNGFLPWLLFNVFVLALLALDLGVFNRRPHLVTSREAGWWSAFWVALSLVFNLGIFLRYGPESALQFFTSYLLEKSLSADNIFIFAVIFGSMGVLAEYQHRVLFWGVLGAMIMRGSFILAGTQLVRHSHAVLYVFAAFLLFTGVRLLLSKERKYDPGRSAALRLARKLFPISDHDEGGRFFTRSDGRLLATPLFLVLIMIEVVDIAFAVDSIPAIFAVTQDAFIIYSSNILAILGLRSLYFLLARAITRFRYLHRGLAMILIFIGAKMLLAYWVRVPTGIALLGILVILGTSILASLRAGPAEKA